MQQWGDCPGPYRPFHPAQQQMHRVLTPVASEWPAAQISCCVTNCGIGIASSFQLDLEAHTNISVTCDGVRDVQKDLQWI